MNELGDLTTERIESLKAGILAALSFTLAYSAIALSNSTLLAPFEVLAPLQITTVVNLLTKLATAGLSGFLFGVTYRYVIREDKNPHLKDGVVLAFGIVRGLAPVEVEQSTEAFWLLGVLVAESVLCFLVARLALNWAIHHHWIKPFTS